MADFGAAPDWQRYPGHPGTPCRALLAHQHDGHHASMIATASEGRSRPGLKSLLRAGRTPRHRRQWPGAPICALVMLAVSLLSLQITLAIPLAETSTALSERQRPQTGTGKLRGDWHSLGESVRRVDRAASGRGPGTLRRLDRPDRAVVLEEGGEATHIQQQLQPQRCKNTLQGKILVSDDRGFTCKRWDLNFQTGCCTKGGNSSQTVRLRGSTGKSLLVFPRTQVLTLSAASSSPSVSRRFSCATCNLTSGCCSSYEYCVSCCLSPERTPARLALATPRAHQASAAPFSSVFEFCTSLCRHNSKSVVHENAYISDLHHCFRPPPAEGPQASVEHLGHTVRVTVAPQAVSCDDACAKMNMRCDRSYLPIVNNCTAMQQHLACRNGCVSSSGTDQPAEVVDLAPPRHRPGVCLVNTNPGLFSCSGFHENTRRLCPCKNF